MNSGCETKRAREKRSIPLPVLKTDPKPLTNSVQRSKTSRWRAVALATLTLLMIGHYIQWRIMGSTVSPIEPSETMQTFQNGAINAGFIFFSLAILATLIFGRYMCGWGCHIVALQDACAWVLRKIGLRPKPFRSRLLIFVPLIAALYMFVWPTVLRLFAGPKNAPLIPQFTDHLITNNFWATFPTVAVAVPFLIICGFMTVYFLGQKGFCTYACPYGGVFVLADKLAPGKIRVTDACNQCGHCTVTCMANVQVHAEVKEYGMVIDPGCMKHMDCISVCPNDALYFGFGKPSIVAGRNASVNERASSVTAKKTYSLSWPEDVLAAAVFLASYLAVWDVYQLVPMLMALGIAAVTTYLTLRTLQLLRDKDVSFYSYKLRSAGKISKTGWVFLAFALLWAGANAHSGWIRYNEFVGSNRFDSLVIPDELALAQTDPKPWLSQADRQNIAEGRRHLYRAFDDGLLVNSTVLPKLAWFEYLSGNSDQALKLLGLATVHQEGRGKALSFYYRGAILNRLKRYAEALTDLDEALAEAPELVVAREERGESLWQLGRKDEAIAAWSDAVRQNPGLPLANEFLAGASLSQGNTEAAARYREQAEHSAPADAYFQYMLGLRLENVGMNALAEKQFQSAIRLDPQLRGRRNLDLLNQH